MPFWCLWFEPPSSTALLLMSLVRAFGFNCPSFDIFDSSLWAQLPLFWCHWFQPSGSTSPLLVSLVWGFGPNCPSFDVLGSSLRAQLPLFRLCPLFDISNQWFRYPMYIFLKRLVYSSSVEGMVLTTEQSSVVAPTDFVFFGCRQISSGISRVVQQLQSGGWEGGSRPCHCWLLHSG